MVCIIILQEYILFCEKTQILCGKKTRINVRDFFMFWAHFFGRAFARPKKPGFPLQVLGFANANPVGFPLQSFAPHGLFALRATGVMRTSTP
jgi:hypothetical protein